MKKHATFHKNVGETPLQCLTRFRAGAGIPTDIPITYAGRLDPMAEGKLLLLIGDECKRRARYDGLDKEYQFEAVFGVSTDTGDVLGLPVVSHTSVPVTYERVSAECKKTVGRLTLPYPAFSSKTVGGTPLFMHAHAGTLSGIEIPSAEVSVHRLSCTGVRTVAKKEFLEMIFAKLSLLSAPVFAERPESDFRIQKVTEQWGNVSEALPKQMGVFSFSATVSSGTYIRSLVPCIASKLGTSAFCFAINRTRIGNFFPVFGTVGLWLREY